MLGTILRKARNTRRAYVANTLRAITGHNVTTLAGPNRAEAYLLDDAIEVAELDRGRHISNPDVLLDAVAFTNEVLRDYTAANPIVGQVITANANYAEARPTLVTLVTP